MGSDLAAPDRLPSEEAVRRFFTNREPCTIAQLAMLTGASAAQVRRRIASGDIGAEKGIVPWTEAVHAFREAWPPHIAQDLLRGVAAYPRLLRVSAVTWSIPIYVLLALERQVARLACAAP